jgi:hypothetical protein
MYNLDIKERDMSEDNDRFARSAIEEILSSAECAQAMNWKEREYKRSALNSDSQQKGWDEVFADMLDGQIPEKLEA